MPEPSETVVPKFEPAPAPSAGSRFATWRASRSGRYVGRVALVALGIVIGAVFASPSDEQQAQARGDAQRIRRSAHADAAQVRHERDAAQSDVRQLKGESEELRDGIEFLTQRKTALSANVRKLNGRSVELGSQIRARRAELSGLSRRIAAAKVRAANAEQAASSSSSASSSGGGGCHPSYSGACLKQGAGDYDCAGGSGDGPNYTGTVSVVGYDEFDLDRDGDGIACDD